MSGTRDIAVLVRNLREIYGQDPGNAEQAIEAFLASELEGLDWEARQGVLGKLEQAFPVSAEEVPGGAEKLITLLLGSGVRAGDIGDPETLSRLTQSLNVLFSTLNGLIGLINSTLGGSPAGDETIRHIIGSSLDGGGGHTIEEYLSQIKKAFLVAQQSSQEAARTIAGHILAELDPKGMEPSGKGFMIGPLKKAEAYDTFGAKYERVKKWFESDRFLTDFLRQFEKNCQKSFT